MSDGDQEKKARGQRTILRSVAYEEVVSYRSAFVSYWAVPIFIVVIAFLCMIGWWVRIPEKVMIEGTFVYNQNLGYLEVNLMDSDLNFDQVDLDIRPIIYFDRLDTISQFLFAVEFKEPNKIIISKDDILKLNNSLEFGFKGSVELIVLKDRFILKLFEDLLTNLKIKSPNPE